MENDRLNLWFELSYASFCVLPRLLMQEMPDEWQSKMAKLLEEYDNTFDTSKLGIDTTRVQAVKNGKLTSFPRSLLNYRRPDKGFVESLKIK